MNSHVANIITHIPADQHPESIREAEAFKTATEDLLTRVRNESPVDLATATSKNLEKVHAAAVEFDTSHAARIAHAESLAKMAADGSAGAWFHEVHAFVPHFAKQFD